jgi:hypothetical protein
MPKCKYCGENAGLFKKFHSECEQKRISGANEIIEKIGETLIHGVDFAAAKNSVDSIANDSFIGGDELPQLIVKGFGAGVDGFLDDGVIDENEEKRIGEFKRYFNLNEAQLDAFGAWTKSAQGKVLRLVVNQEWEQVKNTLRINGGLPFIFNKNETLVWAFPNVNYFETRSSTTYKGGYNSVRVKVAKGVYYSTGSFRGQPEIKTQMAPVGQGILALTTKHAYCSAGKSIKIPYSKMISVNPFADGISIQKEGVRAVPQGFGNIDGWFAYNLIMNLSQSD